MTTWVVENKKQTPNLVGKGPLPGVVMAYWTAGGITVFINEEDRPFDDAVPAVPGQVGVLMGDPAKQLHIIDIEGKAHPLPYSAQGYVAEVDGVDALAGEVTAP